MSTEVLAGLIYTICEVYLDDIIVFGTTEDEFVANVQKFLQACEEKGVTLNPKKCKFGMKNPIRWTHQ